MHPTTDINDLLARFHAGDEQAKRAVIEFAYDRLLVVARGILRGFPDVRKNEETAGVLAEAYKRIGAAMAAGCLPPPAGGPAPARRADPPELEDLLSLAARHIRWELIE